MILFLTLIITLLIIDGVSNSAPLLVMLTVSIITYDVFINVAPVTHASAFKAGLTPAIWSRLKIIKPLLHIISGPQIVSTHRPASRRLFTSWHWGALHVNKCLIFLCSSQVFLTAYAVLSHQHGHHNRSVHSSYLHIFFWFCY